MKRFKPKVKVFGGCGAIMNSHGGKRAGAGRKPTSVKRIPIKAYPTPNEKSELERLASLAGMSLSEYLIECGLAGIIKTV